MLVLVVASSGPGGFRLTRLLRIVAGELWLAGYFKGCFVGGSVREVCAGGEDILLSERDGGGGSRDNGRASCEKRSEREQGREMAHKKVQVLTKISKNRAL